jgi:phosphatidylserine synthase
MSKLSAEFKFLDFSDYGRPIGKFIAKRFKNTRVTPIHVTWMFIFSALIAVFCIFQGHYKSAAFFILLKSGIDAADGELARLKNTPSYTGRYFDSVSDSILNLIFFFTLASVTSSSYFIAFVAYLCCQMQGTLYNFYYVILRNRTFNGDTTSRIFENKIPQALPGESQKNVNRLFRLYVILYGGFDWVIYKLDKSASKVRTMPKWFMTLVSIYGLGFQLFIMAIFLAFGLKEFIVLFFIIYSFFILFFIGLRKILFS